MTFYHITNPMHPYETLCGHAERDLHPQHLMVWKPPALENKIRDDICAVCLIEYNSDKIEEVKKETPDTNTILEEREHQLQEKLWSIIKSSHLYDGQAVLEFTHPQQRELLRIINAGFGAYGEDQQRIALRGLQWIGQLLKKNSDYGSSVFKTPELAPECPPAAAIRVRMSDKISRLKNLLSKSDAPEIDESIEDTINDLGAYCLLLLCS